MKNRAQRRAEANAKPVQQQKVDPKKRGLRIAVIILVAVMLLGVILMPFL
ncbi:MAG: hypothetical protein IJC75_00995 [Oscillospiraceae bacterium]|nr:hypothetical protein [Oscillospiraceae bacterium]